MGKKAEEKLELTYEGLAGYLHANHSVYMVAADTEYYLTDVNDSYWRAQNVAVLNEKGHYTDCSELCPTVSEFLSLPFVDGKTIEQVFDGAEFYASVKE